MLKIDYKVFRSRFASRLFLAFALCALLPVCVLALLSFTQVREQLVTQNGDNLSQEAKRIGLATFNRLSFLQQQLNMHGNLLEAGAENPFRNSHQDSLKAYFDGLAFYTGTGYKRLIGDIDIPAKLGAELAALKHNYLQQQRPNPVSTYVFVIPDTKNNRFFMASPYGALDAENNAFPGYLIAEINASYLFQDDTLEETQTLCIFDATPQQLFCSKELYQDTLEAYQTNDEARVFFWEHQGQPQIAGSWKLFVGNFNLNDDWSLVVTQPTEIALHPVEQFIQSFLLVIAISFLVVLGLSINIIRRVLVPLEKLSEGVRGLKDIHNSQHIELDGGDEFAQLADSYNLMRGQLLKQFQHLEAMSEIDRLILSSPGSDNLAQAVLKPSQDAFHYPLLSIALADTRQEFQELHYQLADNPGTKTLPFSLSKAAVAEILARPKGEIPVDVIKKFVDLSTLYQHAPSLFIYPIILDDQLAAILILGFEHIPLPGSEDSIQLHDWIDRVSVAVSHAKWQDNLYVQAHYDPLTNLPNRLALKDYLQQSMLRADQNNSFMALLFIDLDRFKLINDGLGHSAGDAYLVEIAQRIQAHVRPSDLVARLGGDEFTVVVSDLPNQGSLQDTIDETVQQLLQSISTPVDLDGHSLHATASIGAALYPIDSSSTEELLKHADIAMYYAKKNLGNGFHYYSASMQQIATQRMQVSNELPIAIKQNHLQLRFQAKVNAARGELEGAEVLVRWHHPDKGEIFPDQFIPIAEQSALIEDLDQWVLTHSFQQIRQWLDEGLKPPRLWINMSSRSLARKDLIIQVEALLQHYQLSPLHFGFEITEGALLEDMDKTLNTLQTLRKLGIQIAIDDFGTGYSSLAYLQKLPVDKLKIDKAFVQAIGFKDADTAIIKMIISLAKQLGMTSIAEGVEDDNQRLFLADLGCDQLQGYLFSKPIPATEFATHFLNTQDR